MRLKVQQTMISVIVPVYNVEKYLKKCIESLLGQTYANFEIILIDDGSTDSSGTICDLYASRSKKIRVIHKTNGGVSDARNCAASHAKGKYFFYVDADDYIELNCLSELINAIDDTADIAAAVCIIENPDGNAKKIYCSGATQTFSPEHALVEMCYERKLNTSACAKLISADIARAYPFQKGKRYEDLATVYKMIGASNKIVFLDKPLYHYVQREGSFQHSDWNESALDIVEANELLFKYIETKYSGIYSAAVHRYFFSINELLVRACKNGPYEELVKKECPKLTEYWIILKKDHNVSAFKKIKYWVMCFHPKLFQMIHILLRR